MEKETKDIVDPKDNVTKVKAPQIENVPVEEMDVTKVDLSVAPAAEEIEESKTPPPPPPAPADDITLPMDLDISAPVKEKTEIDIPKLPEGVAKLLSFMEETGGSVSDFAKLNRDVTALDDNAALGEYYKATKKHLDTAEVNFLIEDSFSYDKDLDDETDIKRKQLAFKDAVANAKNYLGDQKSKYYEEIKATNRLTSEQKEAVDFFTNHEEESAKAHQLAKERKNHFLNKTNSVFNDEFKGFEYAIGDKKMSFQVSDVDTVKNTQSDINNFVKKFLNKDNEMSDASGYHKSLFTAMNADAIAKHFYEQGKADAVSDSIASAKNVDMTPRGIHNNALNVEGTSYRVIDGDDTASFKIKLKK